MTIHLKDVGCNGDENDITQCTKTLLSINDGRLELPNATVVGVDCIYDVPTDPPCIQRPAIYDTPGSECNSNGTIRLQGSGLTDRGRLEYCYNGYWSPFCKLDPVTASVVCKQLGFTQYSCKLINNNELIIIMIIGASIYENNEFGTSRNYSLFDNTTCIGSESSIADCAINSNPACTPWCPSSNLGIRCFSKTQMRVHSQSIFYVFT